MQAKWKYLLIVPAAIVVIALAYVIPKYVFHGSDDATAQPTQNQAIQAEIDDAQKTVDGYVDYTKTNPSDAQALRSLADSWSQVGDLQAQQGDMNAQARSYKNAVDAYRQSLAVKEDPEVRTDLGYAYYQLNMTDIAVRELQNVIAEAPSAQRALLTLGFVYINIDKGTDARNAWTQAYNLNPNSPQGQEAKKFLDQTANGNTLQAPNTGP